MVWIYCTEEARGDRSVTVATAACKDLVWVAVHAWPTRVVYAVLEVVIALGAATDCLRTAEDVGGTCPTPFVSALSEFPFVAIAPSGRDH